MMIISAAPHQRAYQNQSACGPLGERSVTITLHGVSTKLTCGGLEISWTAAKAALIICDVDVGKSKVGGGSERTRFDGCCNNKY